MKTFSAPSKTSSKNRKPFIIAGLVVVFALVAIFWLGREAASKELIKATQSKQGVERERYLRALSMASWRSDAAQQALGDYYSSINQPKWAGEAYDAGTARLNEASLQAYYKAGEFEQIAKIYRSIPEKNRTNQVVAVYSSAQLSSGKIDEGCTAAQQAGDAQSKLSQACDTLKQGNISRSNAYKLIALGIYEPALKTLAAEPTKTENDTLTLIALYIQAGRAVEAQREAETGAKQFPYNAEIVRLHDTLK